MKVAVIGAGRIGYHYARICAELAGEFKISEIAISQTTDEAKATAAKLERITGFSPVIPYFPIKNEAGWERMIDEVKPDVAIISSPDNAHLDNSKYLLRKDVKNIYCDKPVTTTDFYEQAKILLDEIKAKDVNFGYGIQFVALVDWLKNKQFGVFKRNYNTIVKLACQCNVHWESSKRGKPIMDLGPHAFGFFNGMSPFQTDTIRTEPEPDGIRIHSNLGTIYLGYKKEYSKCKRWWSFKTHLGEYKFQYNTLKAEDEFKPTISVQAKHSSHSFKYLKIINIPDPLALSLRKFLKGQPAVDADGALKNLEYCIAASANVKTSKQSNLNLKLHKL